MNESLSLFVYIDDMVNSAANTHISKDTVVIANSLEEAKRAFLRKHECYIESDETFESEEEAISAMMSEAGIFEIKVSEIEGIEKLVPNVEY